MVGQHHAGALRWPADPVLLLPLAAPKRQLRAGPIRGPMRNSRVPARFYLWSLLTSNLNAPISHRVYDRRFVKWASKFLVKMALDAFWGVVLAGAGKMDNYCGAAADGAGNEDCPVIASNDSLHDGQA